MVKLPGTIYLKNSDKESEILAFGKSIDITDSDFKEGISRFGGFMRQPSYAHAYLKAAKIVLERAVDSEELDELGLPVFYLVRHTMELKLKGLLEMAYDILEMSIECYPNKYTVDILPSSRQRNRLKKSHDLDKLFNDLKMSCNTLDIEIPEEVFSSVMDLIREYEINPTWSRYSKSENGSHVGEEVVLPIVQLASSLEKLFEVVSYDQEDHSESLESELYFMFTSLTSIMDE